MKLGTETGSLMNHLYSRATRGQPEPEVGMGATLLYWTDRHGATIASVEQCRYRGLPTVLVGVQQDHATRVDGNGMSEDQTYSYSPRPDSPVVLFVRGTDGAWRPVVRNERGRLVKGGSGGGLQIGVRREYHDFSF